MVIEYIERVSGNLRKKISKHLESLEEIKQKALEEEHKRQREEIVNNIKQEKLEQARLSARNKFLNGHFFPWEEMPEANTLNLYEERFVEKDHATTKELASICVSENSRGSHNVVVELVRGARLGISWQDEPDREVAYYETENHGVSYHLYDHMTGRDKKAKGSSSKVELLPLQKGALILHGQDDIKAVITIDQNGVQIAEDSILFTQKTKYGVVHKSNFEVDFSNSSD